MGKAGFSYAESREIISLWQGCGGSAPTITRRRHNGKGNVVLLSLNEENISGYLDKKK
jgi:hypothetical protein